MRSVLNTISTNALFLSAAFVLVCWGLKMLRSK